MGSHVFLTIWLVLPGGECYILVSICRIFDHYRGRGQAGCRCRVDRLDSGISLAFAGSSVELQHFLIRISLLPSYRYINVRIYGGFQRDPCTPTRSLARDLVNGNGHVDRG